VAYRTPFDQTQHLAIVFGDIRDGKGIPVRLHLESVAEDVFGARSGLDRVVARIAARGRGVIVYLREGAVGVTRGAGRSRDPAMSAGGDAKPSAAVREAEWREIGVGAQILKDLAVSSIRLLAYSERRYIGLDGFGIAIDATEIIDG
jgi:3,4-dihydroxy 2-butanone 4-phosphate synthase/GTP cyclohydrolase II